MVPLDDAYLDHFAEAVVQQIWVEMGRQRITSLRELARRAGMTHTSVNVRLNGDSRTGKKVPINTRDLAALGDALGVGPSELLARAAELAVELRSQAATDRTAHEIFDHPDAVSLEEQQRRNAEVQELVRGNEREFPAVQDEAAREDERP